MLFGANTPGGAPAAYCHVARTPADHDRRATPGGHGSVVPERLDLDGPARDLPRGPVCPAAASAASAWARP